MKTIWKFGLGIHDYQEVTMPVGAQILTVQCQDGRPYLWALVDPDATRETRHFRIFGSGFDMPDCVGREHHIGTVQQLGGALVWHVFEVVAVEKGGE